MLWNEGHEQNNACVNDDVGAVGLTENPAALLRWIAAGPEMIRLYGELLCLIVMKEVVLKKAMYLHIEKSVQKERQGGLLFNKYCR